MLWLFCDIFDSARYGLVDAYSSNGNVTEDEVFRGWPIEQHENRVWFLFGALWRVTWWDTSVYRQRTCIFNFFQAVPGRKRGFWCFWTFSASFLWVSPGHLAWEGLLCLCGSLWLPHNHARAFWDVLAHRHIQFICTKGCFLSMQFAQHSKGSDSTILVELFLLATGLLVPDLSSRAKLKPHVQNVHVSFSCVLIRRAWRLAQPSTAQRERDSTNGGGLCEWTPRVREGHEREWIDGIDAGSRWVETKVEAQLKRQRHTTN